MAAGRELRPRTDADLDDRRTVGPRQDERLPDGRAEPRRLEGRAVEVDPLARDVPVSGDRDADGRCLIGCASRYGDRDLHRRVAGRDQVEAGARARDSPG